MSKLSWLIAISNGTFALALAYLLMSWVRRYIRSLQAQIDSANNSSDRAFRQAEHLSALYCELQGQVSLPPTRGWAASPDFLRVALEVGSRDDVSCVVECSSGVSTLVLARCMASKGRGHVFSLENDEAFAEKTRQLLGTHGVQNFATVLHAPLSQQVLDGHAYEWYDLSKLPTETLPPVDLLVIDGPPARSGKLARFPAGPLLFPLLREGGTAILDDADRADEKESVRLWIKMFESFESTERACEKGCAVLIRRSRNSKAIQFTA